jgi:transposase
MTSRAEITTRCAKAYVKASKKDKGQILDQVVEVNYPGLVPISRGGLEAMPRQYSLEFRQHALRLLDAAMEASEVSEFEAIKSVASKLGISEESVRRWRRKAQVDAGERPGMTSSEHAEIRRLERENAELRRADEILKAASAFFAAEFDRPATK